jgi:hypothetical protein
MLTIKLTSSNYLLWRNQFFFSIKSLIKLIKPIKSLIKFLSLINSSSFDQVVF